MKKVIIREIVKNIILSLTIMVLAKTIIFIKYENLETTKNFFVLCFYITISIVLVHISYEDCIKDKNDKQNKKGININIWKR